MAKNKYLTRGNKYAKFCHGKYKKQKKEIDMLNKWRRLTMGNFVAISEIVSVLVGVDALRRVSHIPTFSRLLHFSPDQICNFAEKIVEDKRMWERKLFRQGACNGVFFMPEESERAGFDGYNQWVPQERVRKRLRALLNQSKTGHARK